MVDGCCWMETTRAHLIPVLDDVEQGFEARMRWACIRVVTESIFLSTLSVDCTLLVSSAANIQSHVRHNTLLQFPAD